MTSEATNVKIFVERNPDNRELVLEWYVTEGLENRKWLFREGVQNQGIYDYQIRFTEVGEWQVKARLLTKDGKQVVVHDTVIVH